MTAPTKEWSRLELLDLTVSVATKAKLVPWEFLGGILAEGFNAYAARPADQKDWKKYWDPPEPRFDVSMGLGQKNIRYSAEYAAWCRARGFEPTDPRADVYPGDECIAAIRDKYWQPEYALTVAAEGYSYWRYDPSVSALQAWAAYNGPSWYRSWIYSPAVPHYKRSLHDARALLGVRPVSPVTYNPHEPAHKQEHDYDCSQDSLEWALWSLGRRPEESWMLNTMLNRGIITREQGLMDASGAGLAQLVIDEYGEDGFYANHEATVSFDALAAEAGSYPMLIGGRNWGGQGYGHWSGLVGYDASSGRLQLANTASGSTFGQTSLSREEFEARGPFSMVRVLHPDLLYPGPEEVPDTLPPLSAKDEVLRILAKAREDIDTAEKLIRENFS